MCDIVIYDTVIYDTSLCCRSCWRAARRGRARSKRVWTWCWAFQRELTMLCMLACWKVTARGRVDPDEGTGGAVRTSKESECVSWCPPQVWRRVWRCRASSSSRTPSWFGSQSLWSGRGGTDTSSCSSCHSSSAKRSKTRPDEPNTSTRAGWG